MKDNEVEVGESIDALDECFYGEDKRKQGTITYWFLVHVQGGS